MKSSTLRIKILNALMIVAVFLSVLSFYKTIASGLYDFSFRNTFDSDIYWNAAKRFLETGELYERFYDLRHGYAPSEPVYKFPPAYQLTLLPFVTEQSAPDDVFLAQRIAQIITYLLGCLVLVTYLNRQWIIKKNVLASAKNSFIFLSLVILLLARPFQDTFQNTSPECFIFLLLALVFLFASSMPFLAGFTLAAAVAIKIYPVFFVLYFLATRNIRSMTGFIAGILAITAASIYLVGIPEHLFYATRILPILLTEKPLPNPQNLTLESFEVNFHILDELSGTTSLMIKWITIIMAIIIGWQIDRKDREQLTSYFSLLACGVLMLLANYWLQYQIILLIPLLFLLAKGLQNKSATLLGIVLICAVLLCINREPGDWILAATKEINGLPSNAEIALFTEKNPSGDPFLHFVPLVWVVYQLCELRPLIPAILFFALIPGLKRD